MMRSLCMRLQMSRNCQARSPSCIWKRPARAARTISPAGAAQRCARTVARGRYLVTLLSGSLVRHARHVASAHAQRADGARPRTCQPGGRDGRPRESCQTGEVVLSTVTGCRRKSTRTARAEQSCDPPRPREARGAREGLCGRRTMGLHGKGANIADSDGRHKRNKCCCALKHLPLLIFPAPLPRPDDILKFLVNTHSSWPPVRDFWRLVGSRGNRSVPQRNGALDVSLDSRLDSRKQQAGTRGRPEQ